MGDVSPAPEFTAAILASLDHWRLRTIDLDDPAIIVIDKERQNLFRAMEFGLAVPEAWERAAEIAVQAIPLVNRRMYRQEWLAVLERLVDQAPAGQDPLKIRLLIQYGRMLRLQRQLDAALETHLVAQELASGLGDAELSTQITYNLGRDYLDKRDYSEADRYSLLTLDMIAENGLEDQALAALTYNALGQAARERGDLDGSVQNLKWALDIEQVSGDATRHGRALAELANTLRAAGQPKEAIPYYVEARGVLAPTRNELDKVLVELNLGGAYFELQEWTLAETALRQADYAYLRRSGNIHYQTGILVSLGNILMKQKRWVVAEATLREAIHLCRRLDDNLSLANAVGSLGEALAGQGLSEAEHYFDEALRLLAAYTNEPFAARLSEVFSSEKAKLSSV